MGGDREMRLYRTIIAALVAALIGVMAWADRAVSRMAEANVCTEHRLRALEAKHDELLRLLRASGVVRDGD